MSVYLRPANKDDINLLFEWANDPTVRSNSFNSSLITMEEHELWFKKVLNDPNVFLFILCSGNDCIGQIRLDKQDNGEAVVNYSISKLYRGMGYGKIIIQLINNTIISLSLPITFLIANVKKENMASQLIFERCGYKQISEGNIIQYRCIINNSIKGE